jgi:hypothetical protein
MAAAVRRGGRRGILALAAAVLATLTSGYAVAAPSAAPRAAAGAAAGAAPRPAPHTFAVSSTAGSTTRTPGLPVALGITVTVSSVTPSVARAGRSVVVTGAVHNGGTAPATVGRVRLVRGITTMRTRAEVTDWATGTTAGQGSVIATAKVASPVPAGGSSAFRLTVRSVSALGISSWGVLPVSVEVGHSVVHTFLGYQKIKEYEPLRTAWLVPLTLDPDPALWGDPGAKREDAWERALGPGSRLDRLITGTEDSTVTWAVDPVLLTPAAELASATATPTATPTTSVTATPTAPDATTGLTPAVAAGPQEARLRTETARRVATLAARHGLVVLPMDDADVVAAGSAPGYADPARTLVGAAVAVAQRLAGRADVAWPAGGTWNPDTERVLADAYDGSLGAVVVPRSALTDLPTRVGGTTRSAAGTRLLVSEDSTQAAAARAVDPASAASEGAAIQQIVATSAVVLGDSPGLDRSMLLTLPRGVEASADGLEGMLGALATVPWLTPATVPALADEARTQPGVTAAGGSLGSTQSPLSPGEASAYAGLRTQADVAAQIRVDGDQVGSRWAGALQQLLSARWRGNANRWQDLYAGVRDEVAATVSAVHVAPQTITFLADRGRVQLAVVNDLPVTVDHLTVTLTPDSPRLRIDSPPAHVRIGANSRAAISVDATALAAGPVQLTARILGPTGAEVGREEVVQVRVTPTGSWMYWVLGGIALLVFVLGLARNRHHRRRRDATGPDSPLAAGGTASAVSR